MDLALALVEDDLGPEVALTVAQLLVCSSSAPAASHRERFRLAA
jgi:transcriptional regulator GlxA family with amidase domain